MTDDRPVLNQINLVVSDMDATVEFFRHMGADIAPTIEAWRRHHRNVATPEGLDFDLGSIAFAQRWNEGHPDGQIGPVLGFRLASAEAVDATYLDLTGAGYEGRQAPYDGFMGARYAVVADPDGNSVGLMGPIDPARSRIPEPPAG